MAGPSSSAVIVCPLQQEHEPATATKVHRGRVQLSKIRTQWMLNNSADSRIREVKPLLKSGRKFRAQNEIDESVAELTFEEVRGPTQMDRYAVGWNHLPNWSQASSSTRAAVINQERRRKVEQDRVARAVQQSQ